MNSVFLQLVNVSITAGWVVLAIILLRLVLKKAPKWTRCLLWLVAGVRLVFPFSIESIFSLIPSAKTIDTAKYLAKPYIDTGFSAIDSRVNDYLGDRFFEGVTVPAGHFENIVGIAAAVWVIGMTAILLYSLVSYMRLRRSLRTATRLRDNLWESEAVKSPFILGLFRPKIYLSSGMEEAQLPYVIAHEQAHLRRGDQWWKPLGFVLLMIHWYNPFVWVAYILFCRDLELACDESAVRDLTLEERKSYSYALLSCSMQRRLVTVCPLAFGEVGVKKRVKEVLNYKKPSFWILLAAVVVCVIVAVCFLTNPKDGTTVVLTNEAGSSEADAATNAALEQAAAKQEEVEQLKESLAAQQESLAAGLDTAKQENTTWIYVENSSYSGFFAAKGYVAYAQMEMDGTSIFLVSDGSYQDGDHTYEKEY